MYTKEQILDLLSRKKPELQGRYPISELGLFGSYARGDYNEKSDSRRAIKPRYLPFVEKSLIHV